MKKVILATLALALAAVTLSAKPKKLEVVMDFSEGNALKAAPAAEAPAKPSFKTPITGWEVPTKDFRKDTDGAIAYGFVEKDKEKDGEVLRGYYLPYTAFNFESNGKTYPIVFTTNPTPGRTAYFYYNSKTKTLRTYKPHFSVPEIEGYVFTGFKVNVVPPKKGGADFTFRIYKNGDRKNLIGKTNGDDGEATELETDVEGVQPGDVVRIFSYNVHMIQSMTFTYSPVPKAKKKK